MTEQDRPQAAVWNRVVLSGIGIIQGALIYLLIEQTWLESIGPTTQSMLWILALATPISAVLLVRRASWLKDVLFSVLIGLIAALLFKLSEVFLGFGDEHPESFNIAFAVTLILLLAIPIPFYQTVRDEGRLAFPYPQLFLNAWTNKLSIVVAGIFLGIGWLVFALWGGLFQLIGIEFFAVLFWEPWFISIATGAMFGFGVALSHERSTIIQALLKLLLTLFRVLAPILAGVILLFLVALPFTGLEALWNTNIASRILLAALFLLILFENAVIQSAEADNSFWRPAEWVVMAANVVLPMLAILAGWGILLRVGEYGWTPARLFMAVLTIVALAYALTYAGSVIVKRLSWTVGVIRFNPILALGVLAVAVLVHLPPLEPYSISARDQLARLRDGRILPEKFDFAFLKFKLGAVGRAALEEIESDEDLMKNVFVAKNLEIAKNLDYYSDQPIDEPSTEELRDVATYMNVFPSEQTPPVAALEEWMEDIFYELQSCKSYSDSAEPRCTIFEIDLNADGLKDVAIFYPWLILKTQLQQSDGGWRAGPDLTPKNTPQDENWPKSLIDAIKRGDIQIVPHEYQDVMIDGVRFQ